MKNITKLAFLGLLSMPLLTACHDDDAIDLGPLVPETEAFGKANDVFSADEWYPGGQLGTTEKASYSAATPAVVNIAGMEEDFNLVRTSSNTSTPSNRIHARALARHGCATAVLPAIRATVTANAKRNTAPIRLAMVICSWSITRRTTPTSAR